MQTCTHIYAYAFKDICIHICMYIYIYGFFVCFQSAYMDTYSFVSSPFSYCFFGSACNIFIDCNPFLFFGGACTIFVSGACFLDNRFRFFSEHCYKSFIYFEFSPFWQSLWLLFWTASPLFASSSSSPATKRPRTRTAAVCHWRDFSLRAYERDLVTNEKLQFRILNPN